MRYEILAIIACLVYLSPSVWALIKDLFLEQQK